MRFLAATTVLLLTACSQSLFIPAPDSVASGSGMVILVYADVSGILHAEVHPPDAQRYFEAPRRDDPEFLWLEYDEVPEALGLSHGPLVIPAPGADSRSPPTPVRSWLSTETGPFTALDSPALAEHPLWRALRLLPFDPLHCLAHGGCPRQGRCRLDCPPPVRVAPRPDLPRHVCPAGWRSGPLRSLSPELLELEPRLEDHQVCRPTFPTTPCPPGQVGFGDAAECEGLGDCASDWPADGSTDAVHVRQGAPMGGDGSRAAPFATLSEARAAAPSRGQLVLHGRLELDTSLDFTASSSASLSGSCAARDQLVWSAAHSIELPTDGSLRISGLRIEIGPDAESVRRITAFRGQQLVLDRTQIDSEGRELLVVAPGGSASLIDAHLRSRGPAPRAVLVEDDARLEVRRSVLEGGTEQTLLVGNSGELGPGQVALDRVIVRSPRFGLQAYRAQLSAQSVAVYAEVPAAFVEGDTELIDVYAEVQVPPSSERRDETAILLRGPSRVRGLVLEASDLIASDAYQIVADGGETELFDLSLDARGFEGALLLDASPSLGERVFAMGGRSVNLYTRSSSATLSHLGSLGAAIGVQFSPPEGGSARHRVSQVLSAGWSDTGLRDVSPGLEALSISGAHVHSGRGHGISLRWSKGARLSDAMIEEVEVLGTMREVSGTCLVLGEDIEVDRLSVARCGRAGVHSELAARPSFEALVLRESPVGLVCEDVEFATREPFEDAYACGLDQIMTDAGGAPIRPGSAPPCSEL